MSRSIPLVALIACGVAAAGTTPAAPVPPQPPIDEQELLLTRGKKFLEQGKIDLFVAVTAAWKLKTDDMRQWELAADFGRKLIEKTEMPKDRQPQGGPSLDKGFATYVKRYKPQFKRLDETYFRPDPDKAIPPVPFYSEAIQAPGVVDPTSIANCLVLSRGSVQAGAGIGASVVFANGDVAARTNMTNVVIVCDGDVVVGGDHIVQSVVVARGNITAKAAGTIVLVAGGKIEFENKADILKGKNPNIVVEKEPNPLGFVTFFELHRVGLEVKVADKAVQVASVKAGSACEKAGLKAGDVVLDVGGKAPADAEALRRLLRDALAVGDAALKVRRGKETVTLKVSLPE